MEGLGAGILCPPKEFFRIKASSFLIARLTMKLTRFDRSSFSGAVVLQAFRTCAVALVADVSSSLRSHAFTLMVVLLSSWTQRTLFHGLTEKSRTIVLTPLWLGGLSQLLS